MREIGGVKFYTSREARELLDINATQLLKLAELGDIRRVIPPEYRNMGLYHGGDVDMLVQKQRDFAETMRQLPVQNEGRERAKIEQKKGGGKGKGSVKSKRKEVIEYVT